MMEQRRKHYFPANDITVITGLLPNGEFGAYRDEIDEGHIRGHGHNRYAAIADLVEAISNTEEDETTNSADYRTPISGEELAAVQADRARSIAMAE